MSWNGPEILALLEQAGKLFHSEGYHLIAKSERIGTTRFANSEITDNMVTADTTLKISAYTGDRIGVATVNQLDLDAIRAGIRRAEEIAGQSPADPEYTGPPANRDYPAAGGSDEATARSTPAERALRIGPIIEMCRERKCSAAGFLSATEEIVATRSSEGAPSFHKGTKAEFTMSAKTEDRTGSGWVDRWAGALSGLDIDALGRTAIEKAVASRKPADIQPGRYTVVLEPAACEELLYILSDQFEARAAEEGRNILSRFDDSGAPAGTRLGERLFSPLLTLNRRIGDPRTQAHPFDEDGIALHDMTFIRQGSVEQLRFDPYWAKKKGTRPTGDTRGMVMEGSTDSAAELIRKAGNGILVTRLWYIRTVDWMKSSVTGMTRDGTFRIEGGEIAGPVKNLRFNEELRRVFRDFMALGTPERFYDWLAPAIVVPDFLFTSTTESI